MQTLSASEIFRSLYTQTKLIGKSGELGFRISYFLLPFLFVSCFAFAQSPANTFNVKANYGECDEFTDKKSGVKNYYLKGDTLFLECFFYDNCSLGSFRSKVSIDKDTLKIQNEPIPFKGPEGRMLVELADCNCFFCTQYLIFPYEGEIPKEIFINGETFEKNQHNHNINTEVILDVEVTDEEIIKDTLPLPKRK